MGRHTDPRLAQRRATVLTIIASALLVAGGLLALKVSIDQGMPRPGQPTPSPSAGPGEGSGTGSEERPPTETDTPSPTSTTPAPSTTAPPPTTEEPPAVAVHVRARTPAGAASESSPTQPRSSESAPGHRGGGARPPHRVVQDVVGLVNDARAGAGCAPVRSDPRLQRVAQDHSVDMASHDYLSHTSLDGRTFAERIRDSGFEGSPLGEILAAGQTNPDAVVSAWLDSPPHRAAILNCAYTRIGVGLGIGGSYGHYWTQDLGGWGG